MLQNEMQRLTSRNLTEGRDFADVILDYEDDQLKKPAGQVLINWLSQQHNQKHQHQWHEHQQANLGKPVPTKTDEFSEKFQTAFDPPSFSENHVADLFQNSWLKYPL